MTNYTTDGPWASDSEFISSPDGFIAQLVERDTPRETEANARLIAAAPELLAALELIYSNAGESPEWIRSRIGPAISKATGGAA